MKINKLKNFYYVLIFKTKLKEIFFFNLLLFSFFIVLGFVFACENKEYAELFFKALADKYSFAQNYDFWRMFLFIFKNNILIALTAYLSGVIFTLPSYLILFVNAFMIGFVIRVAILKSSILLVFLSMIPHGIFEIPAILFALSSGTILGLAVFNFIFKKKRFKIDFFLTLEIFLFIVFPLFLIAALIETVLIIFVK